MNLLERLNFRSKQQKSKSLEREINEGNQAGVLLRDTIFTDVIDRIREKIIHDWTESHMSDIEGRETLRIMIEVLNEMVKKIESLYQTGILAQKQKEADEKKKKR